jgi:tetratricopeptide (TPR) repeat protein
MRGPLGDYLVSAHLLPYFALRSVFLGASLEGIGVLCRAYRSHETAGIDDPLNAPLAPISDPLIIPWQAIHEDALRRFGGEDVSAVDERRLRGHPALPAAVLAGYLKRRARFDQARRLYQQLLRRGHRFEALMGLADIEHLLGNWERELEPYRRGHAYRPLSPLEGADSPLQGRGARHHLDLAVDLYKQALRERPDSDWARRHLGRALADAGDHVQALAELAKEENGGNLARLSALYQRALSHDGAAANEISRAINASELFADAPLELRLLPRRSVQQAASLIGEPMEAVKAATLQVRYAVAFDGMQRVESDLAFASASAGLLSDVRPMGNGLLMAGDRELVTDGKALRGESIRLFSPQVMACREDEALVMAPLQAETVERTAILPIGSAFNYYHWMLETLPALMSLSRSPDFPHCALFVDAPLRTFQQDSLRRAFDVAPEVEVLPRPLTSYRFRRVLHVANCSQNTVPHPEAVRMVRDRLSRHLAKPTGGKRVYLSRAKAGTRLNRNQRAVDRTLARFGIEPVDTSTMSIEQQIEFFKDVEMVVAPAGAALTNLLFCPSTTRVVILTAATHHFETFTAIAATIGQPCWVAMSAGDFQPNPFFIWSSFELTVDTRNLELCLKAAVAA